MIDRPHLLPGLAATLAIALLVGTAGVDGRATADASTTVEIDSQIAAAFTAAYNLDQDAALVSARAAVAAGPDVSRAHRALASIVWLQTLFARGAVTVDHYMGGLTNATLNLPKPPADLARTFHDSTARAIATAEAARRRDRRDMAALHDLGTAYGLQASWIASVEGSVMSAFGVARKAYNAEEEVLERDPNRVGAGTVIGTYRYAVASLGLTSRMFAYLAGFGGDRNKAISLLEAASRTGDSRFEARTALVLIFSREGRHADALRLLSQMVAEYPRNRILVLEQGAAAIRAGRAKDADEILSRGLAALDRDTRKRIPGERALWLYKRGLAKLNQNLPTDAAADFTLAMSAQPEPWVAGRLHLEFGKIADMAGRRNDALTRYRLARDLAKNSNDPACLNDADRFLRQPFRMGGRLG